MPIPQPAGPVARLDAELFAVARWRPRRLLILVRPARWDDAAQVAPLIVVVIDDAAHLDLLCRRLAEDLQHSLAVNFAPQVDIAIPDCQLVAGEPPKALDVVLGDEIL